MDTKTTGVIIAKLRRLNGMTQSELAERLNVSDKAVSKWENGQGYPDITVFPLLAELFGVSVDYLMLGEAKSIAIAGSMVFDTVKNIERYPDPGMLTQISDISYGVGGCPPNVGINLAKIDRRIPISVLGKVGNDENGRYIIAQFQKYGIDVSGIRYTSTAPTSFTDVMSVPGGERTFFHKSGANEEFCPEDVDLDALDCSILHFGYILMMKQFDAEDKQFGTVAARFLHDVRQRGIKTSIDVVSDTSEAFARKVRPALKYCDYVIINEIECCGTWDLEPRTPDGSIDRDNVRLAMQKCIEAGVHERVIVHCKECCFAMNTEGKFTEVASLNIPRSIIKGTVGAGDAFCAGCLYGIYHDYDDRRILEFASAAAACNLLEANAVDGMKSRNEIMNLEKKYGRRPL